MLIAIKKDQKIKVCYAGSLEILDINSLSEIYGEINEGWKDFCNYPTLEVYQEKIHRHNANAQRQRQKLDELFGNLDGGKSLIELLIKLQDKPHVVYSDSKHEDESEFDKEQTEAEEVLSVLAGINFNGNKKAFAASVRLAMSLSDYNGKIELFYEDFKISNRQECNPCITLDCAKDEIWNEVREMCQRGDVKEVEEYFDNTILHISFPASRDAINFKKEILKFVACYTNDEVEIPLKQGASNSGFFHEF